jgi:dsDNA-specific endonuclease/ATPase MutS2
VPTVLQLYDKLKPKLGAEEARELLEYVETAVESRAASKADLRQATTEFRGDLQQVATELRGEIQHVTTELRGEIQQVATELRGEIQQGLSASRAEFLRELTRVETTLRKEVQEGRAELLKWSFVFWVGNVAAMAGIVFAMFRAFR